MHPTLKFTYKASESPNDYLEIIIFKGDRFREILLDKESKKNYGNKLQKKNQKTSHQPYIIKAFIFGETLHYATNEEGELQNKSGYSQRKRETPN